MTSGKGRCFRNCLLAFSLGLAAGIFCSPNLASSMGGSGSETQNALVVISDKGRLHGTARPSNLAGAFSGSYVPYNDSGFDTAVSCGIFGGFDFGDIDSGAYNVLVTGADSSTAAFFSGIRVGQSIGPDTFVSVMGPVGFVSGTVRDTADVVYPQLPVFILGSPFFGRSDADGFFSIKNIPAGSFTIVTKDIISRGRKDTLSARADVQFAGGESKSIEMLMLKK